MPRNDNKENISAAQEEQSMSEEIPDQPPRVPKMDFSLPPTDTPKPPPEFTRLKPPVPSYPPSPPAYPYPPFSPQSLPPSVPPSPIIIREEPETFNHFLINMGVPIPENPVLFDRAFELYQLGYDRDALAICKCGVSKYVRDRYVRKLFCNHRLCPVCSELKWKRYSSQILFALHKMKSPHVYIFSVRSKGFKDLKQTVDVLRKSLSRLKGLKHFKEDVRSAAGAVETELAQHRKGWLVHCHLILDVDELDLEYIKKKWKQYTNGKGYFKPHEHCEVEEPYILNLAEYISKPDTRCPAPNILSLDELRALYHGFKGRRVPIVWGTGGSKNEPAIKKEGKSRLH